MTRPPTGRTALAACAFWFALALFGSSPAAAQACSKAITVGTGHWEPYAYYDSQNRFTGIDADMARAIFKEAGCTLVELGTKPAVRNMALFEKGEIDLMTGASLTRERLRFAWFSAPYRAETVGLFALADEATRYREVRSFPDFLGRPLTLLAPRVGWYGAAYDKHLGALRDSGRLSQFLDYAQGIRMLAAGRAHLMLGDAAGIEHAAARQGVKVQPLPFWLVEAQVHLMFSRATVTPADVHRIDAAIVRLQKRGALEAIRHSYGGK
ncbi:MAG: transporter substrate-binding domain-containing protein [Pseudomonadota bacterium]